MMQFCPDCGFQNSAASATCARCGAVLQTGSAAPAAPAAVQPRSQQALALSTRLKSRYLIQHMLAAGGMGAVYLAQDTQLFDKLCVVKELLPYYTTPAEKQQAEQNFEREARLLASLRNPGIPQVFDYFIEGGNYYLVMEWVEGENLEQRLARAGGRLPEKEVLGYALQLANILVYTARQSPPLIHRDIKPSNIIVDAGTGQVKLVDFGLAKASSGSGQSGGLSMPLGTPGYAPPEQYSGTVEARTDVFALGATLHHLLTGRDPRNSAPFHFPPVRSLAPSVSPEFEALIQQTLQMDAAQRPTAAQLRAGLQNIASPLPASALPAPFAFRSGDVANEAMELSLVCDQNWSEAVEHLYRGHFEPWLRSLNRHDLATRAESIRIRGGDQAAGLEEFLRAANPTIPLPLLSLRQATLDLGIIERGAALVERVQVSNAGRGYLTVNATSHVPWAQAEPKTFGLMAGQSQEIAITVNTGQLPEGSIDQPAIELTSNGGLQHISCRLHVHWAPRLAVEPAGRLDFGEVLAGETGAVSTTFELRNAGGGVVAGHLAPQVAWLSLDRTDFYLPSGGSLAVTATVDLAGLGIEQTRSIAVQANANTGLLEIPAYIGVKKEWYTGWPRVQRWLIYGLLALVGSLGLVLPAALGLLALLGQPLGWGTPLAGLDRDMAIAFLAGMLLLSPLALQLSRRWVAELDEIETYHHRGDLDDSALRTVYRQSKALAMAGAGLLLGLTLGWRFGELRPEEANLWLLIGGLVGGLSGGLLAAEGEPALGESRPDILQQPAYAILRSLFLLLAGALGGIVLGELTRRPLSLPHALVGGLVGLALASESFTVLAARLRWLLGFVRSTLAIWLGAYGAFVLLALLRTPGLGVLLEADAYLYVGWASLGNLLWWLLLIAAMVAGGLGGLWLADGAGLPMPGARRIYLGLVGVTALVGFLPYLIGVILAGFAGRGLAGGVIAWLCLVGSGAGFIWLLHARLADVQAWLGRGRGQAWPMIKSGWHSLRARASGAIALPVSIQQARTRLSLPSSWRLPRPALAWPSLDELAQNLAPAIVIGALAVTGLALPFIAQAVISVAACLVPLIVLFGLVIGGLWIYQRSRTP